MKRISVFKPAQSEGKKFNGRAHIDALYDSADWKNFSKRFLEVNPKCYACGQKSQVTDHLVTHKGDIKLFTQNDNVIPLCNKCHNTITARFDRKLVQNYQGKLEWIQRSRILNQVSTRVRVIPYVSKG